MIIRSQISITRPNVIDPLFMMMAAMISVPPVLPLEEKGDAYAASAEGCTDDARMKG